jgi:hypothetical protein
VKFHLWTRRSRQRDLRKYPEATRETKATNTDIRFGDLATDAQRFLSLGCSSRILPVPLATLLLVIWFQATSVSLGELALSDFGAFARPFVLCEQLPIVPRHLATLYPVWWRGYSVGYKGGISGEYGDTIFVENGMKSNYGVWIWLGKTRINFRRKLGYRNFSISNVEAVHENYAETSGVNFRVPRKFLEIADR